MTSAYLGISFLKQTRLPEKQLRRFLSYLPQDLLKEYLQHANIYRGKNNRSKHDLIGMTITEKDKTKSYTPEDDDLTQEEANKLLNNNNFAKPPDTHTKPNVAK